MQACVMAGLEGPTCSGRPRSQREFGVSSRKMPPSSSVVAGTMHSPSDRRQPQGYSFDVPMLIICTPADVRHPSAAAGLAAGGALPCHGMSMSLMLDACVTLRLGRQAVPGQRKWRR